MRVPAVVGHETSERETGLLHTFATKPLVGDDIGSRLTVPQRRGDIMIVFLDFEASSLGKHGFPIEVGWAAEDGTEAGHLIRPAPGWEEWSADAESVHGIALEQLQQEGEPHAEVAERLVRMLSGHDLYASAPSWDGHWLSLLLRASGIPRHTLRLRDTEDIQRQTATAILAEAGLSAEQRDVRAGEVLLAAQAALSHLPPAHRALQDARRERRLWQDIAQRSRDAVSRQGG